MHNNTNSSHLVCYTKWKRQFLLADKCTPGCACNIDYITIKMPKQFEVWVILCFLKRKNGALRARPPPIAAALFSFIRVMSSPSSGKAPGEKNCYPRASNLGRLRHRCSTTGPSGLIGICFTKLEMAGKSLLGEEIRQTQ